MSASNSSSSNNSKEETDFSLSKSFSSNGSETGSDETSGNFTDLSEDESFKRSDTEPNTARGCKRKRKEAALREEEESDTDLETKYHTSGSKVPRTFGFVYRLLRDDESSTSDLKPKAPKSRTSIENHVLNGTGTSRYISTCRTYEAVRMFLCNKKYNTHRVKIVKINLDLLDSRNIIDAANYLHQLPHFEDKEKAITFASKFEEILIDGTIPRSSFKLIYCGSVDDCPDEQFLPDVTASGSI